MDQLQVNRRNFLGLTAAAVGAATIGCSPSVNEVPIALTSENEVLKFLDANQIPYLTKLVPGARPAGKTRTRHIADSLGAPDSNVVKTMGVYYKTALNRVGPDRGKKSEEREQKHFAQILIFGDKKLSLGRVRNQLGRNVTWIGFVTGMNSDEAESQSSHPYQNLSPFGHGSRTLLDPAFANRNDDLILVPTNDPYLIVEMLGANFLRAIEISVSAAKASQINVGPHEERIKLASEPLAKGVSGNKILG